MLLQDVIEDVLSDESIGFHLQRGSVPFAWELTPGKPKLPFNFCAEEEQNLSGDLRRSIHILEDAPHGLLAARHSEAGSEASFQCRISAAVPFKWEEEPGISKFPMHHVESTPCPLNLPPSRQKAFCSPHANGSRHAAPPNKLKHYLLARFSATLKQPGCASHPYANSSSEDSEISRQASSYDLSPRRNCSATRAFVSGPSSLANFLLNATSIKDSSQNCHGSHPAKAISQKNHSSKTHKNNSRDRRLTASHAIFRHVPREYMDRNPELQHTAVAARNVDAFGQTTWGSSYEQKLCCPSLMAEYLAFEESLSSESRSTNSSSHGRSSEMCRSGDSSNSSSQQRMEELQSHYFSCNPCFGSSSPVASRSHNLHMQACNSATCGGVPMGICRGSPRLAKSCATHESSASPWSSLEKPIPARSSFLRSVVPNCIPILRVFD